MTEAQLLVEVLELCRRYGLWWFHAYDSRRLVRGDTPDDRTQAGKGWVDLVIVGNRGAVFAELKSETERRSMAQIKWAGRLQEAGQTYRLWRPADLDDGTLSYR